MVVRSWTSTLVLCLLVQDVGFLMITETDAYWGSWYILLYFSYRGNNDVAGHAFASAREPIEQEVGVYFVSYDWYNQPIRLKLEKEYSPGGYFRNFWVGMCRWDP